ncbi:hypothetical protein ACWFMI_27100 [Nocardiopsis terrae]
MNVNVTTENTTIRYLPSDQVRTELGTHMAWVAETEGIVVITDGGTPAGGLVPSGLLTKTGLVAVSEQGVRDARAHWGVVRARAATDGPQGLTHHKNLLAVLVDQTTASALTRRMPVLAFDELELTGFALADGELVAPGDYAAHHGTTLRIRAPRQQESPMNSNISPIGPETPDEVIFEAMRETANRAAAAYMRAAEAATTPQAKEEAMQKMKRSWKIKSDHTMGREEMAEATRRLQEEIDALRES